MARCINIITGPLILVLLFLLKGCYKEIPFIEDGTSAKILSFDQVDGMVDWFDRTIMFTIGIDSIKSFSPEIKFYGYNSFQIMETEIMNGEVNEIGNIVINQPYLVIGRIAKKVDTFHLIFTSLPLMHITSVDKIPDEPKVLSKVQLQYCKESDEDLLVHVFKSYVGTEIRGKTSLIYNKKSYAFELWVDKRANNYSASLLGMRYGKDWILDAMYVDKLRMRNKISFEVWERVSRIPEEDQKPDVFPGIHCKYIELFINNRYSGLYCLSEKLDDRLLQYTSDQYQAGGVLYKAIAWSNGSTRFETYNSEPPNQFLWDGWELIYPDHQVTWGPLAELRSLVVHSNDTKFKAEIGSIIDLKNIIDYYLFINLLLAHDNTGKNSFLARYTKDSPFFFMPWDVEGSWGRMWDGSNSLTSGIVLNQIIHRLSDTDTDGFNRKANITWNEYRDTHFHKDSIMDLIENHFNLIKNSGAIQRENKRWDVTIDLDAEYSYISHWLEARLEYLDKHFVLN